MPRIGDELGEIQGIGVRQAFETFVMDFDVLVIFVLFKSPGNYLRRMFPKSALIKALAWGLGITLSVTFLLHRMGVILIDFKAYVENITEIKPLQPDIVMNDDNLNLLKNKTK